MLCAKALAQMQLQLAAFVASTASKLPCFALLGRPLLSLLLRRRLFRCLAFIERCFERLLVEVPADEYHLAHALLVVAPRVAGRLADNLFMHALKHELYVATLLKGEHAFTSVGAKQGADDVKIALTS